MSTKIQQYTIATLVTIVLFLSFVSTGVQAHNRWSLSGQSATCYGGIGGGYSEYIQCAYGRAEVHFQNTYATDSYAEGHCAYTRRYVKATDRHVEVKSCGSTKRLFTRNVNGYDGFAACITGHWFCHWR
ncbi:MAG: hypothetical protein AB8B87_26880 [Granulosicoccus sp.]